MLRTLLIILGALLIVSVAIYIYISRSQFGALPSDQDKKRYAGSPHFNSQTGRFQNSNPIDFRKDMKMFELLQAYWNGGQIRTPSEPLPEVKPDWEGLLAEGDLKWIWLGHSTLYLNLEGRRILIDPVLHAASPVPYMIRRFQKQTILWGELPKPDVVILSHDHYDHLDAAVMRELAASEALVLVPLGLAVRLSSFGIPHARIRELDWDQSILYSGLNFRAVEAQHFSGRSGLDDSRTFWAGWVIEGQKRKVFYSGDTGYSQHFKSIGAKYGPFDIGFMESGQYNERWRYVHMLPEEVVQASLDLGLKDIFPVHWGMYNLSIHDWFEPIERVSRLAEASGVKVWSVRVGGLSDLSKPTEKDLWWRQHPDFIKRGSLIP